VDLIGSEGNFAAEIINKVDAWNQVTGSWTTSATVSSGSILEIVGSGGNFAFRVSNQLHVFGAGTSTWYTSQTYSGFQELISAGGNFAIRLSSSILVYDDTTNAFHSASISADVIEGAALPPCSSGSCFDANSCSDDVCNLTLGCEFPPNADACEDGDLCTTGDACMLGVCEAGSPLDCDDGNACTADSCDELSGCANDPIPDCSVPVPAGNPSTLALLGLLLAGLGVMGARFRRRETLDRGGARR
jgi:hypothetical protein